MPTRTPHGPDTTDRVVVVLKSPAYGDRASDGPLPYRIDLLRRAGLALRWSDANQVGRWAAVARRTEPWTLPWTQAVLTRRDRRDAVATVAMFESEGHGLALFRRLTGRRRPPLVIVACWLADLAKAGGPRRSIYRWLYRSVDAVVVFSPNQRETLVEHLGLDPDTIVVVPFGIDLDDLQGTVAGDGSAVVAAGRDRGRDWGTLIEAARGTGWSVPLVTRPSQVEGLELPPEVEFQGTVDRDGYLSLLAGAGVVVVPTHVREYPTGQTVLLEAMAMGKACVVTDTPAMRGYVDDGVTALLVPPADPVALQAAIRSVLDDDALRHRLGEAAKAQAVASGGAVTMWEQVAEVIARVARS